MSLEPARPRVFLTAEWRRLAMLNYEIDPAILEPYLLHGLELDFLHGRTYVSLGGFLFRKARIFGLSIPFHRNFPEVNLRFYATRLTDHGERCGVVFLKEIVPRWAAGGVARWLYREKFVGLPLTATIESGGDPCRNELHMKYKWSAGKERYSLVAHSSVEPMRPPPGSLDEFIVEHYWGYSTARDGGTIEYEVEHDPWVIRAADEVRFTGDAAALYGKEFGEVLSRPPASAFLVDGSAVAVRRGRRVEQDLRATTQTRRMLRFSAFPSPRALVL